MASLYKLMINKFNNKYRISSTRLPHWDYSSEGYYFVTICTKNKESILGEVKNRKMVLSEIGIIADKYWLEIPKHFPNIELDIFQVMPNHLHGIIVINHHCRDLINDHRCRDLINQISTNKNNKWILMESPDITLGKIIRFYKAKSSYIIHKILSLSFSWQKNYYEHIIRNDRELFEIREYIENNPLKWELDEENPIKKIIYNP